MPRVFGAEPPIASNPASGVERRKVCRRIYETLRAEEVPVLLARLAPRWRPLFATAIWTGMRKGELLGLRKSDVDLEIGTITIRRSYDADTTKGGHAGRHSDRRLAQAVPSTGAARVA